MMGDVRIDHQRPALTSWLLSLVISTQSSSPWLLGCVSAQLRYSASWRLSTQIHVPDKSLVSSLVTSYYHHLAPPHQSDPASTPCRVWGPPPAPAAPQLRWPPPGIRLYSSKTARSIMISWASWYYSSYLLSIIPVEGTLGDQVARVVSRPPASIWSLDISRTILG